MKKLFYVILIVVALMVISRFVKQDKTAPEPVTAVVEETVAVDTCNCETEMKEKGTCACAADSTDGIGNIDGIESDALAPATENNADAVVVEESTEEVEEIDPSSTQNDDETIVKE